MKLTVRNTIAFIGLLMLSNTVCSETYYSITAESAEGAEVINPESCVSNINDGNGDFKENEVIYSGKCDGAGNPVEIQGTHNYQKYLHFSTDPSISYDGNDRTELAITKRYFPFGENLYIGFRIMIPDSSDVAEKFYYLMQLWQCAPQSPISGIRLTTGTSHTINFMTRTDSDHAASFVSHDLTPNVWHDFVYRVYVDPNGNGSVSVWKDEYGTPANFYGSFGFNSFGKCHSSRSDEDGYPSQDFRLKFGIYKGNEVGKSFVVKYDDIRVGSYYKNVKPW